MKYRISLEALCISTAEEAEREEEERRNEKQFIIFSSITAKKKVNLDFNRSPEILFRILSSPEIAYLELN